ncbi:serine hydrolase [Chloroflexota bacterium]
MEEDQKIRNAYLLVHSKTLGIHLKIAEGSTNNVPANENQPYFIASIGKLFTSVLAGILVEQGKLSYEDTITQYLDDDLLHNLHVYKGKDYANQIRDGPLVALIAILRKFLFVRLLRNRRRLKISFLK